MMTNEQEKLVLKILTGLDTSVQREAGTDIVRCRNCPGVVAYSTDGIRHFLHTEWCITLLIERLRETVRLHEEGEVSNES